MGRISRLGARLAEAGRARFVGRQAEIELFQTAVLAPEPPFSVLHVVGPGGVGKSALLAEMARAADEAGVPVVRVDGRNVDASPAGFQMALATALGLEPGVSALDALCTYERGALLVDTYESLMPVDSWLRDSFIPQLPAGALVVLAGRNPPTPAWRTDPGWRDLVRVISLRNLRPDESRLYLRRRGIPDERHDEALEFTHGHPLALSLVADLVPQEQAEPTESLRPDRHPDLVSLLLGRFIQHLPDPLHGQALAVCAIARTTTEDLLGEALEVSEPEAHGLFEWLRGLSFIEQGPAGLFPHDLARDVLDSDLRWRSRDSWRRLHDRVRSAVVRRLQAARGMEQQRVFFDLLFLHHKSPFMRPYYEWQSLGSTYAEPATERDHDEIVRLVRQFEGDESARIAAHWLQRQPRAFTVFRADVRSFNGFFVGLRLDEAAVEDLEVDPGAAAAWHYAQRVAPWRPGEHVLHHRFGMERDTYQSGRSFNNMGSMVSGMQWLTDPKIAWSFLVFAEPERWAPMFSYCNMPRTPEAEFEVGGRHYGVFSHNWQVEPALAWLDLMGAREQDEDLTLAQIQAEATSAARERFVVLAQEDFEEAVRGALRDFHHPAPLAANPLLRSRLLAEYADGSPGPRSLQGLLRQTSEELKRHPRDERLYRVLHRTYFEPAATQELAAEVLDLPYSTYRRHLAEGIRRLSERLWHAELYGLGEAGAD